MILYNAESVIVIADDYLCVFLLKYFQYYILYFC